MSKDGLRWVYAVARAIDEHAMRDVRGVAGAPVRAVTTRDLVAVVSDVDTAEFGADQLRSNFEDLDWLAAVARAHDEVVHAVSRNTAVIPFRLGTVYTDDDRVREVLAGRAREFEAALDFVAGRIEWGVKVYVRPDAIASHSSRRTEATEAGAGTAYLMRRRAQLSARETATQEAAREADAAHARLMSISAAVHTYPVREWSPGAQAEVLNAAYLVDESRSEEFRGAFAELRDGCSAAGLDLTGPWPPYSFTAAASATAP